MKDNIKLALQALLLIAGPLLAKHGISADRNDIEAAAGAIATLLGIVWKFWHWNTTPDAAGQTQSISIPITKITPLIAVLFGITLFLTACAHLQPGADPIVVRVEQTETVAKGTFDAILGIDDSLGTNAPGLHKFCGWLRTPQIVGGTNTLPRCYAMILSLDDVKLSYKAGRATSNEVFTVLFPVETAFNQASAWLTVTTNSPAQ